MEKELINKPVIDIKVEEETATNFISRVVLYNDDWHTFDEVIYQLIKAVHCTYGKARTHAFEV
ncbi:MAG TPA: hypothetical protein ENI76_04270, partial [Ignavibacteria bacterium]|nr:hypothetical protein [Ignavibacteria bacterium]